MEFSNITYHKIVSNKAWSSLISHIIVLFQTRAWSSNITCHGIVSNKGMVFSNITCHCIVSNKGMEFQYHMSWYNFKQGHGVL